MSAMLARLKVLRQLLGFIHNPYVALGLMVFSILITSITYWIALSVTEARKADSFEYRSSEIAKAIEYRLYLYEQVLWSGVGLFNASDEVTRSDWRRFVETLQIEAHWPGIQGFGFSVPLEPENVAAYIDAVRKEGFPDFSIEPAGEREFYTSIKYLEPFDWRNQRAFGFDMWSNQLRREAMKKARDTGRAALSGRITLVQETEHNSQNGFLLYVPVYDSESQSELISERQFIGWVYAPFRIKDFLQGILGGPDEAGIAFALFDSGITEREHLLYASEADFDMAQLQRQQEIPHSHWYELEVQGRTWGFFFYDVNGFLKSDIDRLPGLILFTGVVLNLLLFYVILSLHFVARNMDRLLHHDHGEALQENEQLKQEHAKMLTKQYDLEAELNALHEEANAREHRVIELKKEVNSLAERVGMAAPYKAGVSDEWESQ